MKTREQKRFGTAFIRQLISRSIKHWRDGARSNFEELQPIVLLSATPTFTATAISGTEVLLSWDVPIETVTGYTIRASANSSSESFLVGTVSTGNADAFLVENLAVQTTYTFTLLANNDAGTLNSLGSSVTTTYEKGTTGCYYIETSDIDESSGETDIVTVSVFAGSKTGAAFKVKNADHPNYELISPVLSNKTLTIQVTAAAEDVSSGGGKVGDVNIGGMPDPAESADPIRYANGEVIYAESDLTSYSFGTTWGQTRTWSQSSLFSNNLNGNGWNISECPWIQVTATGDLEKVTQLAVVLSSTERSVFNRTDVGWESTSYLDNTLTATTLPSPTEIGKTVTGFIYADTLGNQYIFYGIKVDPDQSSPDDPPEDDPNDPNELPTPAPVTVPYPSEVMQGRLYAFKDVYGNVTTTDYNSDGELKSLTKGGVTGSGTSQNGVVVSIAYTYYGGIDPNSGKISSATLTQQNVVNGVWQTPTIVRQVQYTYYEGTYAGEDAFGNRGDLKTATILDSSNNVIDVSYYRYYTPYNAVVDGGYAGGLQYVFGASAVVRLQEKFGSPYLASNDDVAIYAAHAFEYNQRQQATEHTIAGTSNNSATGDSVPGVYTYMYKSNPLLPEEVDNNIWTFETIETLPDGNQNLVFTNRYGQLLMNVFVVNNDTTNPSNIGHEWITAYQYDDAGRVVKVFETSALTGYDINASDLGISQSQYYAADGLIEIITYATDTTATFTSAGDAAGYISATYIQQGTAGQLIEQESYTYFQHQDIDGNVIYVRASDTIYKNTDGTGTETVLTNYTWFTGTNRIASITTTLPVVITSQNGSGTAAIVNYVYDQYGRTIWTRDAAGTITYRAYDAATGAVIQYVEDVNTNDLSGLVHYNVALPSGWITPVDGGLNLVTSYSVDAFGRTIRETDPKGNVTYTLYDDANHAVLTIAGATKTVNTNGNGTITSSQAISLVHRRIGYLNTSGSSYAGVYDETITFSGTLAVINGVIQFPDFNTNGAVDLIGNGTSGQPQFVIRSLDRTLYDSSYTVVEYDNYAHIDNATYLATPANNPYCGSENVNYNATTYGYDVNANLTRMQDAGGTISIYQYDALNRLVAEYVGTSDATTDGLIWQVYNAAASSNMILVTSYVYDNNGVGKSSLTKTTKYVNSNPNDNYVTEYLYDWRGRLISTKEGVQATEDSNVNRSLTVYTLDNLGEILSTSIYDADGLSMADVDANGIPDSLSDNALRARTLYSYDNWGRVYRTETLSVDQTTGTPSSSGLVSQVWYDQRGNLIKKQSSTGLVTKYAYDSLNRLVAAYDTDGGGDATWASAGNVAGDIVLDQDQYVYDANGNVIETIHKDRFHNATGTGALGDSNSGVLARVSYTLSYYDSLNRLIADVNVGTNGGVLNTSSGGVDLTTDGNGDGVLDILQGAVPTRSDNVLVYSYTYTTLSLLDTYTDAKGIVTKYQYDNLGHKTAVIEAYTDGIPTDSTNRTTLYTYDAVGHITSMTAVGVSGANSQTTQYVYGVTTASGSTVNSNNLLSYVAYPDKATGLASTSNSDQVHYTYDSLGEVLTATDQNGSVHTYTYDILGRQTSDTITTLGTGVDGSVRRIDAAYDIFGNITLVTSYADTAGTQIVNQIKREYNNLGQLTAEYQATIGAVDTATTPKVQYSYSDTATGNRLLSTTYPNGRVVYYNYNVGIDGTIGRLSSISDSTGILESYTYLGLSNTVIVSHPETGINLTYVQQSGDTHANTDAGDQYTGLDRFGRVIDQFWTNSAFSIQNSEFTADRYQYAFDRNSNVTAKNNLLNTTLSETYTYDNLDRLTSTTRNGTTYQTWDLDSTGNAESTTTNGTIETNTYNSQNQIVGISYDANGNTLTDEAGNQYSYDAWNHLVQVKNSSGNVLKSYTYDSLGRRVTETTGSGATANTTTLYYNASWQVVEEHSTDVGTGIPITTTYVWSATYIDVMICRDRTATLGTQTLHERVYALHDANYNVTALVSNINQFYDVNADGSIDFIDLGVVLTYWGANTTAGAMVGDCNLDGSVDEYDLEMILYHLGESAPSGTSVLERYTYDAYGKFTTLNADGTTKADQTPALGWNYLHQGGRYDATTGLYNFRNRDYNPDTQRWMQQDPLGYVDGANRYQYVRSNPIHSTDPNGTQSVPATAATPGGAKVLVDAGLAAVGTGGVVYMLTSNGDIDYSRPVGTMTPGPVAPPSIPTPSVPIAPTPPAPTRPLSPHDIANGLWPGVGGSLYNGLSHLLGALLSGKCPMERGDSDPNSDPKPNQQPAAPADKPQEPDSPNENPTQAAKKGMAKDAGGIPRSAQPTRQGTFNPNSVGDKGGKTRWWEYKDANGNTKIVVEHPDGSVHVGTPKPQSTHLDGGPPKYYPEPGTGHIGE